MTGYKKISVLEGIKARSEKNLPEEKKVTIIDRPLILFPLKTQSTSLSFTRHWHLVCLLLTCFFSFTSCNNSSTQSTPSNDMEISQTPPGTAAETKTILFFGNSLTAGYEVEPSEAFPALIQQKIDSSGLNYKVINAGVSGETTAAGNSRVDWILKQPIDIFVLELGANDGLRGIPLKSTKENLQSIIDKVRAAYPQVKIILAGMQIPPNMGPAYTSEFREIFPELAKENNIELIPFLLENVAGEAGLNQRDGVHPTAEGYKIVAENVWEVLEKILKEG